MIQNLGSEDSKRIKKNIERRILEEAQNCESAEEFEELMSHIIEEELNKVCDPGEKILRVQSIRYIIGGIPFPETFFN